MEAQEQLVIQIADAQETATAVHDIIDRIKDILKMLNETSEESIHLKTQKEGISRELENALHMANKITSNAFIIANSANAATSATEDVEKTAQIIKDITQVFGNKMNSFETGKALHRNYPSKPIIVTIYVPQGGSTDAWCRKVGSLMEKELAGNTIFQNLPGESGKVAIAYIENHDHDGHKWLGASEGCCLTAEYQMSQMDYVDWQYYIAGGSPGVLAVRADSNIRTFDDLVNSMKDEEKQLVISHSGSGQTWHIKAYVVSKSGGLNIKYLPKSGSASAIRALINEDCDMVSAAASEILEYVKAGELRPVAMLENEDYNYPGIGLVPSITKAIPQTKAYYPISQWLGFMIPSDTDSMVLQQITDAFELVVKSEEVIQFADENASIVYGLSGKVAKDFALSGARKMEELQKELEQN